jgi:predicted NUDIX family NTP pyrophosphohydrolase
MNHVKILMVSVGAAALSLGFSLQPHPAPFWETNIVIAGEESVPKGNVQSDEDSSSAKSAKMGKEEGTQTGGANLGTPSENDTQKIDQPARQNPKGQLG